MILTLLFHPFSDRGDARPQRVRMRRDQAAVSGSPSRDSFDDHSNTIDLAVVERIRAGDEAAFEALFLAVWQPLVTYAARLLRSDDRAVDIVQDVLVWVWEQRTSLPVRESLRGYLYTAVRRRALSVLRHDRVTHRTHALFGDAGVGVGIPPLASDERVINAERQVELRRAIAVLPERGREVIVLRWYHGLAHAEIARVLGISQETVHVHLTRAMSALRRALRSTGR